MKQVKDLYIGDKVYKVDIENITSTTIDSLSLDEDTSKIKVRLSESYFTFYGEKTDAFIMNAYNEKYFADYENALKEQTKLRIKHYLYLLNNVEEAQKALSEFILEYSIFK